MIASIFIPIFLMASFSPDPASDDRFVHTVFFWMKADVTQEQKGAFYQGLMKLKAIDSIETGYVGVPASTNRPVIESSYDYSITFVFKTAAEQDAYQSHPDHLEFIAAYNHLWEKVVVYDAVSPK